MIQHASKHLLLYIFSFIIVVFFLLTSNQWVLRHAVNWLTPKNVQVQQLSGSLASGLHIKRIKVQTVASTININNVKLRWQLFSLLLGNIEIAPISIASVDIENKPHPPKQAKKSPINPISKLILPLGISVPNFTMQKLTINGTKQLEQFHANILLRSNHVLIRTVTSQYRAYHFASSGFIYLNPISSKLTFSISKGKRTLFDNTISAFGDWQHLIIKNQLQRPIASSSQFIAKNLFTANQKINGNGSINTKLLQQLFKQPLLPGLQGRFKLSWKTDKLSVSSYLTGQQDGKPQSLNLDYQKQSAQQTLAINWNNILTPTLPSDHKGELLLTSADDKTLLSGNFVTALPNIPEAKWLIDGQMHNQVFTLNKLRLDTLNGSLTMNGYVDLAHSINYQGNILLKHIDLGKLWSGWHTQINASIQSQGNQQQQNISVSQISGDIHNQVLSGNMNAAINAQKLNTLSVKLNAGKAFININASLEKGIQARWNIHIPKLESLTPIARGTILSEGNARYQAHSLSTQATLQLNQLFYQKLHIVSLLANFQAQNNALSLNTRMLNTHFNDISLKQTKLDATGTPNKHTIHLEVLEPHQTLQSTLQGGWHQNAWRGKIERFNVISNILGNLRLAHPSQLNISKHQISLKQFNLLGHDKSLNASIDTRLDNKSVHINKLELSTQHLPLNLLNSYQSAIRFQGYLNTHISAALAKKQTFNATINTDKLRLKSLLQLNTSWLNINHIDAKMRLNNQHLASNLTLTYNKINTIQAKLDLNGLHNIFKPNLNAQVEGNLNIDTHDLSLFKLTSPYIEQLTGHLYSSLRVSGQLNAPLLFGKLSLSDATLSLPVQGLMIKHIQMQTNANQHSLHYTLSLNSGKGFLNAKGDSEFTNKLVSHISLTGKNATVINNQEFQIAASPKLAIAQHNKRFKFNGDIAIDSANIDLRHAEDVATIPNTFQIIQHAKKQKHTRNPFQWLSDVQLSTKQPIELFAPLFHSFITGKLSIHNTAKNPITGTGELILNKGTISAFGQQLFINNGRLIFTGSLLNNPGLDIRATRNIQIVVNPTQNTLLNEAIGNLTTNNFIHVPSRSKRITIGAYVTNTALSPHISLFSDQAGLTQADILSYLILGLPLSQTNGQQAALITQAANLLTANGSEVASLITGIKRTFSLDTFALQNHSYFDPNTNTVRQNPSITLGKNFSENLYLSYAIGLLDPINTLGVTYNLSKNWQLQLENNDFATSGDIVFNWGSG